MVIQRICGDQKQEIEKLSAFATAIVREHFDPLIGTDQNDYMLERFQTVEAITCQLEAGYRYYWVKEAGQQVGFLAFYPRDGMMYLSKFYIEKQHRGKHYASGMLDFVIQACRQENLPAIYLNVNRNNTEVIAKYMHLGFEKLREEKNDIGNGFFMDDYVLIYHISDHN